MKKAIQFGAGNIGRGFIGAVLEQAGYHVVFADVNEQVVARINSDRAYTVQIMDTVCEQMRITDISAMDSRSPELAAQIAGAELVTTAVGLTVLPRIAGAIAAGIAARRDAGVTEPLNVIACENGVRATTQLREAVLKHLDEAQRDWCEQYVGFPDCSVDRIVPPVKSENPIDVVVERFFEWNVERAAFKGAVPEIPGMNPADNLIAYIERKLFTLNTGHAITAYLGRMKGYMTICQSISDEHIHTIVKAAMRESGRGLVALYGFDRDAHFAYIDKIIGRFRNPYLCDDVTRVGREPLRKLSAGDRLVRPILTAAATVSARPTCCWASAPRCITTTPRTCRAWKCAVWSKKRVSRPPWPASPPFPTPTRCCRSPHRPTTKWNVSSPKSPKHNEKTEPPSPAPGRMLRRRAARVRPGPDTARRADRVDRRTASLFHL